MISTTPTPVYKKPTKKIKPKLKVVSKKLKKKEINILFKETA